MAVGATVRAEAMRNRTFKWCLVRQSRSIERQRHRSGQNQRDEISLPVGMGLSEQVAHLKGRRCRRNAEACGYLVGSPAGGQSQGDLRFGRGQVELNPVDNVWQYLRHNWLSNRVFEDYDAIINAVCTAWKNLIAKPATITSIGSRKWAHVGQN